MAGWYSLSATAWKSAWRFKAGSGQGIGFVPDAFGRFFCAWKRLSFYMEKATISRKIGYKTLGAKNNDSTSENGLSLFFTLWNIESATIPTNKTIAAHARVHPSF